MILRAYLPFVENFIPFPFHTTITYLDASFDLNIFCLLKQYSTVPLTFSTFLSIWVFIHRDFCLLDIKRILCAISSYIKRNDYQDLSMDIYVVSLGDNIDRIAADYGVSADSIIYNNQLVYPYELVVGQALLILFPDEEDFSSKPQIRAGGYAYTYISPWVLEQTLPFLTELFIFSYGFTSEGELLSPPLDDYWMIQSSLSQNVRPILTLTPLDASGQFNNNLITSVINNASYKQN